MTTSHIRPSAAGTVGWPPEMVRRYVAAGYWDGQTLTAPVVAAAAATPEAVALVDGAVRFSYHELAARVDGAALRLRGLGLRPDDRVLVQLPNGWEFIVLTLACLRLGVIPVLALTPHRHHEMSYLAEHAEARAIAVPARFRGFDHRGMAHDIARAVPTVQRVLVSAGEPDIGAVGATADRAAAVDVDLRALCRPADDVPAARTLLDAAAPDSRAVALMVLSGGTTGLPKLIARTHDDYGCHARRTAEISQFGRDTVYLAVLPMAHSMSLGMLLATLRSGGRVIVASSPAPVTALGLVERERVTATAVVPAIAQSWLNHQEADPRHDLRSVRLLLVGGARLPDQVAERMVPTLTRNLQQGYGMAEGLVCLTRIGDPDDVTTRSQGRPICADDEIILMDEDGRRVPPGEPGVLLTRGPCTPRGYYRAAEHNACAFVGDGWLWTGDIVRIRDDGNVVVEGRDKDMINRGGEKVSAEEVENLAYQVDGVGFAAAVAMPDPDLGELVCLYVVPRDGARVTLADVRSVMESAGVARFKWPERLELVGALPRTNIGKIDKKALRSEVAARLAAEVDRSTPAP
ncbi:(2,3-dihydroxybenzoyl)adenylate synthase [Salinispora arenicola]|uniref:(2,3-dihydroxybenzoyl)adenylate synthase n=1 Tax=Salinispora arenicola TaxID=168697 RepID=UPI00143069D1|nr:AMP-binding protein [Salinispora arenicola]NIL40136.1 (2,3-dihydroxybenzoyl)adenylate synthase [Salinispora arenicola]